MAEESGAHNSRVRGDRQDMATAGRKLTVQFASEQQVRQLGILIGLAAVVEGSPPIGVVEVQLWSTVKVGAQCHDAAADLGQQQIGQCEVAEVVGTELQFEAVRGASFGDLHDAGVVYQDSDRSLP